MKSTKGTLQQWIGGLGLLCLVVFLSPCSAQAGEALRQHKAVVGKWKEIGGTETIEFFKNGTVTYVYAGRSMHGTYEIVGMIGEVEQSKDQYVGFGEIRMEFNALGAPALIGKVSSAGDELVLTPTPANGAPVGKFKKLQ